jgi:dienelactone hydrolase
MKVIKIFCFTVVFLFIASILMLFYFSPLFNPFPQPTGPYGVGVISLQFKDPERREIHAGSKRRELVVDFYYPAHVENRSKKFPYQPATIQALKKIKSEQSLLHSFVWNRLLGGIESYAEPYAPIASTITAFPVIIFSHGIGSYAFYSVYLEQLASLGYIVAFVHHPYDIEVVAFPDGRVIEIAPEFKTMQDGNERTQIYNYRAQAHSIWIKDLQFVIDYLGELNKHDVTVLYQKMDLNRIAVIGHSHGGGVAIDLCKIDPRVKMGIDLDGWTKTANTPQGFNKPFLFLLQENGLEGLNEVIEKLVANSNRSQIIRVKGAEHRSFSDFILLKWPLVRLMGIANGDPETVRINIQNQIGNFLAKNL